MYQKGELSQFKNKRLTSAAVAANNLGRASLHDACTCCCINDMCSVHISESVVVGSITAVARVAWLAALRAAADHGQLQLQQTWRVHSPADGVATEQRG